MPRLVIGSQIINFPDSGSDSNWSPAVIQFAEAVADQLLSVSSPFDLAPRVQILSVDTNNNLPVATFTSAFVRSFVFTYAIYRTNGTITLAEDGVVSGIFNTAIPSWSIQHEFNGVKQSNGAPYHTFSMSGDVLQLSTVAIGGAYNGTISTISFSAKTNLVSNP